MAAMKRQRGFMGGQAKVGQPESPVVG
jgi:hypothetical protein